MQTKNKTKGSEFCLKSEVSNENNIVLHPIKSSVYDLLGFIYNEFLWKCVKWFIQEKQLIYMVKNSAPFLEREKQAEWYITNVNLYNMFFIIKLIKINLL